MKNTTHLRRGFTLVELLVVIAIIGILIGMLLPAVQQVREAARRTTCSNNIRQLALAVHSYESARQRFPVNQIGAGAPTSGGFAAGYYSWMVPVLPFIEQQNVFNQFDLTVNNGDGNDYKISDSHPNAQAVGQLIDAFLCPSDTPNLNNSVILGSANPAPSSYASNAGWPSRSTGFSGERSPSSMFNGVIPLVNPVAADSWHGSNRIGFQHIVDGASNTTLISERLIQQGNSGPEISAGDERTRSLHILERFEPQGSIVQQMSSSHSHILESAHIGRSWSSGWPMAGPTYMHVQTPNKTIGHYNDSEQKGDFVLTAGSQHTSGVNVALVDGSVKFISNNISQDVWWGFGSRDDGRTFSLED